MRILFLAPYPPYPPRGGGMLRIYNLLAGLAKRHAVTCLTFAPNDDAAAALGPLRQVCRVETVAGPPQRRLARRATTTLASPLPDMALRNAAPAYAAALERLLATERFDIIQAESIEMASYGALCQRAGNGATLILDEFNAEYVLQRRAALTNLPRPGAWLPRPAGLVGAAYSLIQWRKLAAYERRLTRMYDRVLAVSDEDRCALLHLNRAADLSVVPNGVDTAYFAPRLDAPPPPNADLTFTGTLDFRPNVDAVTWFARVVLPLIREHRLDARFVVVGRNPAPNVRALHNGQSIVVTGEVADVRPFIASAAVYVVPIRMGGGVRLKLLEALSMQAPVVSTTMGAAGIPELRDGVHALLADSPDAFAAAVIRLLDTRLLGAGLGAAGRSLAREHYDWSAIVPRLEAVYQTATQRQEL